jgi:LacI family transcriptional regulator
LRNQFAKVQPQARRSALLITMADVAKAAGVSVTTVSHVVNKTRRVSPKTAAAVELAIETTGYIPDQVARSIRTGDTRTIGCAISAITNPYFGDVVHGVERAAYRAGYSLLLADTHDQPDSQAQAVATLLSRRVDAVVLAPTSDPSRLIDQVTSRGLPMVLIDRLLDADLDQIGSDNSEPTAELVDHLAQLGHQRIAMIAGRDGVSTTTERVNGFVSGMARNGLTTTSRSVVSGQSTNDGAYAAANQLMSARKPPTALVVGNNRMTIGVMRALREMKLCVPRDVALVAFDDFEWAEFFEPRLTVVAQATVRMGERAIELILSRLADPSLPARRERLPVTFVHRDSCGTPEEHDSAELVTNR